MHMRIYVYTYIGVQADGNTDIAPLVCRPPAPVEWRWRLYILLYMHGSRPPRACPRTPTGTHARTHTHTHTYIFSVCVLTCLYVYMHMHVYIYVSSAMRWCAMSYKHTGRRALTCTRTRANIFVGGCTVGAGGCTVAVNIYTYI